jgi:stress response protein YsnF
MESSHIEEGMVTDSSDQFHPHQANESLAASQPASSAINQPLDFQDGEVIRIELYEEVPTIHRKTVACEKVYIKKVINLDS